MLEALRAREQRLLRRSCVHNVQSYVQQRSRLLPNSGYPASSDDGSEGKEEEEEVEKEEEEEEDPHSLPARVPRAVRASSQTTKVDSNPELRRWELHNREDVRTDRPRAVDAEMEAGSLRRRSE